jgi:hypothetical protein
MTLVFPCSGSRGLTERVKQAPGSHYFVPLIQRGREAVSVSVRALDAIAIVALLYERLLANEPHLGISHSRATTDRLAGMMRGADRGAAG